MAQSVEHVIGHDEVISSILITSSKKLSNPFGLLNFLSNPKDWYVITPLGVYVICTPCSMASSASVYPPEYFGLITYTALP